MSMLITIFGGMLLTLLLYVLGRTLRASNFWSAVVSAGVPLVMYMAYATMTWPRLDVLTMHVVAYPTVAVMLYLLYGEKAEHAGGMHWAPKIMVGFFLTLTVLFGGFVYVARQGLPPAWAALLLPNASSGKVHTGFAGIVAHGEDADSLRPDHANEVRVDIRDKQGAFVPGVKVVLALVRPGQKAGQGIALEAAADSGYHGMTALPGEGAWVANISLEHHGEVVELEHTVGGE
jgi:hypothetical protein